MKHVRPTHSPKAGEEDGAPARFPLRRGTTSLVLVKRLHLRVVVLSVASACLSLRRFCGAADAQSKDPYRTILIEHVYGTFHATNAYLYPGDVMLTFLLWCLVLIFCWPLALLVLVLYPIVWLILLPFRILGIAVEGVLELLKAIIFLPARVLRGPSRAW